jgi:hypothetical protein
MTTLSRRRLFSWFAASSSVGIAAVICTPSDVALLELGRQFDEFASNFDLAVEGHQELSQHLLRRMNELAAAIDSGSATTLEGLRVKARVAAWALSGDFDVRQNCSLAEDMCMSIIRDLIRNFDPNCESPGAIARLIDSATS